MYPCPFDAIEPAGRAAACYAERMSPFVYVIPVLAVAALIYSFIARRKGLAATGHVTVGAVAGRLGLQVVEGDPSLNLYYLSQPGRDYRRNIRLEGAPQGRRMRWDFTDGIRHQDFLVVVKRTTTWGCFLVVEAGVAFPEFEITLRAPNEYLVPETMLGHLPEAPTGDPSVDQTFCIRVADPRWAPALAPVARALAGQLYVHVVGQGGSIMMPITRMGLPYFAHAAEQYAYALEVAACGFEGKQAPAAPPPPAHPM